MWLKYRKIKNFLDNGQLENGNNKFFTYEHFFNQTITMAYLKGKTV